MKKNESIYEFNNRFLYPLSREHLSKIKEWRNAQMKVLRQWKHLTDQDQKNWFSKLSKDTSQVIFAIMEPDSDQQMKLIGYCGITNIDYKNRRGEISFLVDPLRARNEEIYGEDFLSVLYLICQHGFKEINLHKLFAETFAFREYQISLLEKCGFHMDGKLRDHELVDSKFYDSVIQSVLQPEWSKIQKMFRKNLGIEE